MGATVKTALARLWHLRRAYQLAAQYCSPVGRMRVLAGAVRIAAADLAPGVGVRITTLDLGDAGSITVRDFSELLVLWEVFVACVYDVPELPVTADVIVDCGCNVGASLIWFHRRYPGAQVVGYEADPVTAELARRNTSGLPGVAVHAAALAADDGETSFHRLRGQSWASGTAVAGGTTVAVPAVSLDSVVRRAGGRVDILKVDVEGAEHAVLAAATRLDALGLVVGEYHPGPGVTWATLRRSLDGLDVRPRFAPDDEVRLFVASRPPPHGPDSLTEA